MQRMSSAEIRESFLKFFQSKNHQNIKSAPVVVNDDPTIMFTNSGMNQFKGWFLGESPAKHTRVVNWQKCLRVSGKHNDLEEVGKDHTHHTFFEMLGNWSFGDYFKEEAITWAWQLVTEIWNLPKEKIFVTVHKDDKEAEAIWKEKTDIEHWRILRFDKDNFWEMGEVGPCGPSSELFFDMGDPASQKDTYNDPKFGVNGSDPGPDRYVEFWNLVFMENERKSDGSLTALKQKHVDTGSGLERVASILQQVDSNYDTDLFKPIIDKISAMSGVAYQSDIKGMPHRVMADHIRALIFAIADGVTPGNEGRGYVIRRILRRAARYARQLELKGTPLADLFEVVREIMQPFYPEIGQRADYIKEVIESEELRFNKTLDSGLSHFEKMLGKAKKSKELSGEDAFKLSDTYGFPLDLTKLLADENGLTIDEKGYHLELEKQKTRARGAQKFDASLTSDDNWTLISSEKTTEFLGYTEYQTQSNCHRYAEVGDTIFVILDKTPFYAESGGQVGDKGWLKNDDITLTVYDTVKMLDLTVHCCEISSGLIKKTSMQSFQAQVDEKARKATMRNHSATHLLQSALKEILGDHVAQQGSQVSDSGLRFDFTHHQAVSQEQLQAVEKHVNESILMNATVATMHKPIEEAKAMGAIAMFGEKYGDQVRVVEMGDRSLELCGGTHCQRTGDIGVFKITGESSISAGIRRIEAITGQAVLEHIYELNAQVSSAAQLLKVPKDKVLDRIESLVELQKSNAQEIKSLQQFKMKQALQQLQSKVFEINAPADGNKTKGLVIGAEFHKKLNISDNVTMANMAKDLINEGLILSAMEDQGQTRLIVLTHNAKDLNAGKIFKSIAASIPGSRGGGKGDRAQGIINGSFSDQEWKDHLTKASMS